MDQNTEKQPLFSLITITLNNIEGLQKTYNSVQNQTLKGYEWLAIDGNSSDGTKEWLKTVPATAISEADNGIYDAMNKGIERAKGKYILFLNAGDTIAGPETLHKIADTIKNDRPDFIYGDSYEDKHYKRARAHKHIARGMITSHQAMLYRRATIGNLRYSADYKIAADYDFTARFLSAAKNALYCQFPICNFESGGLSQNNAAAARTEESQIRKALGLGSPLESAFTTARQTLAQFIKTKVPALYRIMR